MVAVGVQDRPSLAPQEGPWDKGIVYWGEGAKFSDACAAVSGIVLSFAGTPTYFPMASEMRDPRLFTRAILVSQGVVIAIYLVSLPTLTPTGELTARSSVVSSTTLSGNTSTLPLLDPPVQSSSEFAMVLLSQVFWSRLSCTSTWVDSVSQIRCWTNNQFSAKYLFVRSLRGTVHLSRNTTKHWIVWLGSIFFCAVFAYVIASAIPGFGSLVNLIGASVGTLVCIQPFVRYSLTSRRGEV